MKGELITNIDRLAKLAKDKKAVVFANTNPRAAAFFMQWRAAGLLDSISRVFFYEYIKPIKQDATNG